MKYNSKNDTSIMNDINLLKSQVNLNSVFINVTQKNKRQRIGATISQYIAKVLKDTFNKHKTSYKCIKKFTVNNKSPKEPYEILLDIELNNDVSDIYVNLLPTNKLKNSSPYIGSINKYINRLKSGHIYDMIFFIKYDAVKGEEPSNYEIDYVFVKDIDKMSLYKNWQLQVNIQTINHTPNTSPEIFIKKLSGLLDRLDTEVTKKIKEDCKNKKDILTSLKL